jgi:hypothetical protein
VTQQQIIYGDRGGDLTSDLIDQIIAEGRRPVQRSLLPETDSSGAEVIDDSGDISPIGHQWQAKSTTGEYDSEEAAKADFVSRIRDDHWDVLQEVSGEVMHPRIGCSASKVRADYVLWPKPALVENGWRVGPICIEVKRSGYPLGSLLGQAMDYMRCAFTTSSGVIFIPQFCVVFPLRRVTATVQSLMSSHRVGHSHVGYDGDLRIYLNGQIAYSQRGGVALRSAVQGGKKFGSRRK